VRRLLLQPAYELKAIDLGHADVGDHQIGGVAQRSGQRLGAARAADDAVGSGEGC
jgi:hypothetical protein